MEVVRVQRLEGEKQQHNLDREGATVDKVAVEKVRVVLRRVTKGVENVEQIVKLTVRVAAHVYVAALGHLKGHGRAVIGVLCDGRSLRGSRGGAKHARRQVEARTGTSTSVGSPSRMRFTSSKISNAYLHAAADGGVRLKCCLLLSWERATAKAQGWRDTLNYPANGPGPTAQGLTQQQARGSLVCASNYEARATHLRCKRSVSLSACATSSAISCVRGHVMRGPLYESSTAMAPTSI